MDKIHLIDGKKIYQRDLAYYLAGEWKCKKSPSGAHYWVGDEFTTTCKYCLEVKMLAEGGNNGRKV